MNIADTPNISPKQAKVLIHLANGMTHKQIAFKMAICPRTVMAHVYEMRKKFDVGNAAHLIAETIRRKYLVYDYRRREWLVENPIILESEEQE